MARGADGGTRTEPERPPGSEAGPESAADLDVSGRIDESLKTRTMDEAPVGITVADARQPDMPLVYVNEAFERITGYSGEYAIGRNCRFLQGEATKDEPVARMRTAIENGEATTVELQNYRKDGELFWNEVTIAPLRDDNGEITHYVGFQRDVTRRKQAERDAAERAARIEREQRTQERLLERLDGVIAEVTEAVTRAESRATLERDVVQNIEATYAGAWIGTYDPSGDVVVPDESVGNVPETVEKRRFPVASSGVSHDSTGSDQPGGTDATAAAVAESMADRYVHFELIGAESAAVTSVAVIPLHYGDATYGSIGVYTRNDDGFASHEREVLTALGRTVATGINALESQRTLQSEAVIELQFEIADHPLVGVAAELGCQLTYVGSVGDRRQPAMLFEVESAADELDADAVRTAVGDRIDVQSLLNAEAEAPLIELTLPDSRLRSVLADHGGEFREIVVTETLAQVTVEVGQEQLAQSLADATKAAFGNVELTSYRRREHREQTQRGFVADLKADLTDRQYAALIRAYTAGYFEWPHDTNGEEIAESMGLSRSTFHQHLRAAERKLVGAILDQRTP